MASRGPAAGGPKPNFGSQMMTMLVLMLFMFLLFEPGMRQTVGNAVGIAFSPLLGFGGQDPVLTLFFTGLMMSAFTIIVRHFFTDWVEQARNARISSAFNKEHREARMSNNTYKIKKLTEIQPQITAQQMKTMGTQMKLMPATMIVIVPVFAWLANFVYFDIQSVTFSVPWAFNTSMLSSNVLQNWILLYSLLTLPFGQVLTRVLKYFSFTRRLSQLERGDDAGADEVG
jgi:uncharacterized membrane protein (DUF106 family)